MFRVTPKSSSDAKASPKDLPPWRRRSSMPIISAATLKLKKYKSRFPFAKTDGIINYRAQGRTLRPIILIKR